MTYIKDPSYSVRGQTAPLEEAPEVKPTVHDIAREAGVSLATVDRVLNARPGVRQITVARVQEAIRSLGYVRDLTAANLASASLQNATLTGARMPDNTVHP